jgi:autotransporter-associated beta strand protein
VSDGNGGVLLGRNLPQGTYDVSFEFPRTAGGGQPTQQRVLVGLLLPAVQAVRGVEIPLTPGLRGRAKLDVGPNGALSTITWTWSDGGITATDYWEASGLAAAPSGQGETRLVFLIVTGADAGGGPALNRNTGGVVAWTDGHAKLSNVGVGSTGPGGVMQLLTDNQGFARFDKLPVGNTLVDFKGSDLTSALRTAVGPSNPKPQETLIELLVVIAIIGVLPAQPEPQVVFASYPATAIPRSLQANLRVGRDGNLMGADFGTGEKALQSLTKAGLGTLQLGGNTYSGNTTVNQGLLKTLQGVAGTLKQGETGAFLFAYDPRSTGGGR